jgi:hypothetical protein
MNKTTGVVWVGSFVVCHALFVWLVHRWRAKQQVLTTVQRWDEHGHQIPDRLQKASGRP